MANGHYRVSVFGVLHGLAFQSGNGAGHCHQPARLVNLRVQEFLAAGDKAPGSVGILQRSAITAQRQFQDVKCGAVRVVDGFDDSAAPDDDGSLAGAGIRLHLCQGQRLGLVLEVSGNGISHTTRDQHWDQSQQQYAFSQTNFHFKPFLRRRFVVNLLVKLFLDCRNGIGNFMLALNF